MNFIDSLVPGAVSFLMAFLLTPVVRRVAIRLGIVDAPDGFRKLHGRVVPLGGGMAVLLAVGISTIFSILAGITWGRNLVTYNTMTMVGVASGAVLISLVGLLDDRFRLRGRHKLLGQVTAALVAIFSGVLINRIDLFGWQIELGLLAVPFTLFWLLGAVNALNLIDGMDGLATTVGLVLSLTIAVIAASMGKAGEAAFAIVLAGALAGFLPYNWSGAKIFLGDTGSMLIGFLLGILAIRGSMKGPTTVALVAPTALWAIPVFDVTMAILRRKLTGQSIYATDRGHLHHVLQRRGFGNGTTVLIIAGMCALCGLGAIVSVYSKNEFAAVVVVCCTFLILVLTRSFGHSECHLLLQGFRRFAGSFLRFTHLPNPDSSVHSRFHGDREFDSAWQALLDCAGKYELSSVIFNINAPMLNEVYHARWKRPGATSDRNRWETEIPLLWQAREIGRIHVVGNIPSDQSPFLWTSELMESLKTVEVLVLDLFDSPVEPVLSPIPTYSGPVPEYQLNS